MHYVNLVIKFSKLTARLVRRQVLHFISSTLFKHIDHRPSYSTLQEVPPYKKVEIKQAVKATSRMQPLEP